MQINQPRTAGGVKPRVRTRGVSVSLFVPSNRVAWAFGLGVTLVGANTVFAQSDLGDEATQRITQETAAAAPPLPGQVDRPVLDPEQQPWVRAQPTRVGVPATAVDLDPAIIGPPPGAPAPPLRREGDFVVDQLGRLRVLPGDIVVFDFLEDEAQPTETTDNAAFPRSGHLPSMVLQPCQRLESMLSAADQQGASVLFRLTGQVHAYRGVNYLLPTELTGYQTDEPPPPEDGSNGDIPSSDEAAADAEALREAAAALDEDADEAADGVGLTGRDARDPLALMEQMADELAEDVTDRRVGTTGPGLSSGISAPLDPERLRQRTAENASNDATNPDAEPRREGEILVNRAGRLTRAGDARQVLFVFESDGPTLAEPPIAVLPCRLRAYMEDAVTERGDAQAFTVTGKVYRFQGRDYLLPTTVRLRINHDHLGG